MTYTLAVVDEGLLGLTRYATPNPWDHFYAREALGVRTWDLYDQVLGAWGGVLERLLAIGGDEEGVRADAQRANRFPPMVRFLGPFRLAAGAAGTHDVDVPQYVGAVRVMVVAGRDGAFGAADRQAFVRRPLMILATLPRVLGPEEQVALPVSVFAMEPQVQDVEVSVKTSGPLQADPPVRKTLLFDAPGDDLVSFDLRTASGLGVGTATVEAVSGSERAVQTIEIDVRMSTQLAVDVLGTTLQPGESWTPRVSFPGLPGTNEATLEVSRTPPSTWDDGSPRCCDTRTAVWSRPSPPPFPSSPSAVFSSSPRTRRNGSKKTSRPPWSDCSRSRPRAEASATGPATTIPATG